MNHARAPNNPSAATNEKQAGASPSLQEHHPYAVTPLRRSSRQRRRVDRLLCCDHEGEAGNDKPDLDWIVDDDDGDEYVDRDDRCEDDHELEEDHCSKIEHNLNRDKSTLAQCNGELRLPRGKRDKSRSLAGLAVRFSEYIRAAKNKTVCLAQAQADLKVKRRRLYDVINILEGTELVYKLRSSLYQWVEPLPAQAKAELMHFETIVADLKRDERKLDFWIARQLKRMNKRLQANKAHTYIRSHDCKQLVQKGALLAVSTTAGSVLQIEKGGRKRQDGTYAFSILPAPHTPHGPVTMPVAYFMDSASGHLRRLAITSKPPISPTRPQESPHGPETLTTGAATRSTTRTAPVFVSPSAGSSHTIWPAPDIPVPPHNLFLHPHLPVAGFLPASVRPVPLVASCSEDNGVPGSSNLPAAAAVPPPPPPLLSAASSGFGPSALEVLDQLEATDIPPVHFYRQTSLDVLASVCF